MFKYTYIDQFSEADSLRIIQIENDLVSLNESLSSLEKQAEGIINQIQLIDEKSGIRGESDRKIYYNNLMMIVSLIKYYQSMYNDISFFRTSYCKIVSEIQAASKKPWGLLYLAIAEIAEMATSAMSLSQIKEDNKLFYFHSLRKWRKTVDRYYDKERTFAFNCDGRFSDDTLEYPLDYDVENPSLGEEDNREEQFVPQFIKKMQND